MTTLNIIMGTTAALMLLESLIIAIFPKFASREIKRIFKNTKTAVKTGLIEMITALVLLFIISF